MLELRSISVEYSGIPAVKEVSLSVPRGCCASLIGPNGCGKSTLLKAAAHLLRPSGGAVLLEGEDSTRWNNRRVARTLAYLPQQFSAPGDYTVRKLVEFGRTPFLSFGQRLQKRDLEIIDWAISEMNLDGFQDRQAGSLSGGERQRVWIAMRLAQQPKLLLLDEPTTYLDIAAQYETLRLVRRLNREMGLTVLMVLHDLNQAARFSDLIFAMREGRLEGSGTPKEMITAPMVQQVFGIGGMVTNDPEAGTPMFVPEK